MIRAFRIRLLTCFISVIFLQGNIFAQSEEDSLQLNRYIGEIRSNLNKDASLAKIYLDSLGEDLVRRNPNTYIEASYEKFMGIYYFRLGQFENSLGAYKRSAALYGNSNFPLDQAKIMVNTSMTLNKLGQLDSAIVYARKANKLFEELGDSKGVGISLNIIGQIFFYLKDYEKAKSYFQQYLNNATKRKDTVEISSGYNNLGSTYNSLKKYDSALIAHRTALQMAKQVGNKYSIANIYQNIAAVLMMKKLFTESISYYDTASVIYSQLDYEPGLLETNMNLGKLYVDAEEPERAIPYLKKSIVLASQLDEPPRLAEALKEIADAYDLTGEDGKAFVALKQHMSLSDSLFNLDKQTAIEDINTKYETEKKEQQIVLLNQENALKTASAQRNTLIIISLSILIILLVLVFYFLRYRSRQRHQAVLQEQKVRMRENQMQAVIDSQEAERKRFATDLHDGMGQLISALQLNIQAMNQTKNDLEKRDQLYSNSTSLLKDVHTEIRNIAFNLMPQTLTKEGLVAALKELIKRINKTGEITVHFSAIDMEQRLPEVSEVSLYRIIQEFLSNIMKYSQAENVYLGLTNHGDEIVLTIEDDGIGYDLQQFKESEGNGWRNINTRLNLINGEIDIDTVPGRKGTSILINMPAKKDNTYHTEVARSSGPKEQITQNT